jgi:hypothetical protein
MTDRKSFFNEHNGFTIVAQRCDSEIQAALRPIFARWVADGYSPRELAHLITGRALEEEGWAITESAQKRQLRPRNRQHRRKTTMADACNKKCTAACITCHGHSCARGGGSVERCDACAVRPTLYNKDYRYTSDAEEIDRRALAALQGIFNDMVARGYNPREIAHVIHAVVFDLELNAIL